MIVIKTDSYWLQWALLNCIQNKHFVTVTRHTVVTSWSHLTRQLWLMQTTDLPDCQLSWPCTAVPGPNWKTIGCILTVDLAARSPNWVSIRARHYHGPSSGFLTERCGNVVLFPPSPTPSCDVERKTSGWNQGRGIPCHNCWHGHGFFPLNGRSQFSIT